MDRIGRFSITNCVKELESLEQLVLSERYTSEEIADFIKEISWNLNNVLSSIRYTSDEFQYRLKKIREQS